MCSVWKEGIFTEAFKIGHSWPQDTVKFRGYIRFQPTVCLSFKSLKDTSRCFWVFKKNAQHRCALSDFDLFQAPTQEGFSTHLPGPNLTWTDHGHRDSNKSSYCWWFRNPAPADTVSNLSHYLQGFSTIQGSCLGFLNHQQYLVPMLMEW